MNPQHEEGKPVASITRTRVWPYLRFPKRPLPKTLRRVWDHCDRRGWWPSAADLVAKHPGAKRSRIALFRDLQCLEERGLVRRFNARQWCVTLEGCVVLGRSPVVATKRWRQGVPARAKLVDRLAVLAVLEVVD